MTDDREPFREARAACKAKHHEQRLENATYTAAEVKVLTEAALRLGRKEAGEEIATAIEGMKFANSFRHGVHYKMCAAKARDIASQPAGAALEPRTEASGYSDLPQDSQAVRSPQGDPNG